MAYEMNDLKGILFLVLFAIPIISSANINCSGKAFHCVNSTHFRICVDLGGGVSTTIDDFIIPCPPTTVCHEQNIFECEFPRIGINTARLDVIGVSIQSDASVPSSVINSETASTLPIETQSVISSKENVTVTTSPKPEEMISAPKVDISEGLKQHTGVRHNNNTDTVSTIKVNSNSTYSANEIGVEKTNQNIIKISDFITNNSNKLESTTETSTDKTVTATLTDIFTFKDATHSVTGLLDLISNNPQSVASSSSFADVLTALNTSNNYNATTIDKYITREVTKSVDKIENDTDEFNKPKENIAAKVFNITDEISTTPMAYTQTKRQSFYTDDINNHNDSVNHNLAERKAIDEMTTTEKIPESRTESNTTSVVYMYTESFNIDDIINNQTNSVYQNIAERNAAGEITTIYQIPNTRNEVNTNPTSYKYSQRFDFDDINNETNLVYQKFAEHATGEMATPDQISETITEINTTPTVYMYSQRFDIDDINNQTNLVTQKLRERNATGEITASDQIPETVIETNTTPMVNLYSQTFNINDINNQTSSVNKNLAEQKATGEITTIDQIIETSRTEINTTPMTYVYTQKVIIDDKNNQTDSVNQNLVELNATGENAIIDQIPETRNEINTTPMVYMYTQTFKTNDINIQTSSVNQHIPERNTSGEISTIDQIPEIGTKYLASDKSNAMTEPVIIVERPQETTEKTYGSLVTKENITSNTKPTFYTTLEKSISNDTIVVETATIAYSLETIATTDTPIESADKSNPINKKSLATKDNGVRYNNTIERLGSAYNASSSDLFIGKVTEPTLFQTSTVPNEILTTETFYKTEVINELPVSFSFDEYHIHVKADTVINIDTTPAPYNATANSDRNITVADWTNILTNASTNIISETFVHYTSDNDTSIDLGTTENVINSNTEDRYQNVVNKQYGTEAVIFPDKVNIDQTTKTVLDDAGNTTIYWKNLNNIATPPYARDENQTTISVVSLELQNGKVSNSVNSINQKYNSTVAPNVETIQSEVPKAKLPQPPPLNQYATGFTTQTPEFIHKRTIRTNSEIKIPKNVSKIVDIHQVSVTDYKIENNTTIVLLAVTHDNNIDVSTDRILTTSPQEPFAATDTIVKRIEEIDKIKQVNITLIATETVSDSIPSTLTTTHMVINEKDTNFNTSNCNDSVCKDTMMSIVNPNEEVIKNKIINSINGINVETTTPHSRIGNDDGIVIMSPFNTANMLTNGTLKMSSLNKKILLNSTENNKMNELLDANIETTTSRDLGASMNTTMYNAANENSKGRESVLNQMENLPKNSLTNEYSLHQTLTNLEVSPTLADVKDVHTDNVEDTRIISSTKTGTETPLSSTIEHDDINLTSIHHDDTIPTENTNIFILSQDPTTDYSTLPIVGIDAMTTVNSLKDNNFRNTPGSVITADGFTKTTTSVTSSKQINSPLIIHEEVKSNNVQLITELPLSTEEVIETQTFYRNEPNFTPQILEVTQMTTEPAHETLFLQTTLAPIAKTNSDIPPLFITTERPLYQMSTKNYFNPLSFRDKTTETITVSHSVTVPDFMVETMKVNQDKISGTNHLGNLSEATFNNRTVNNSSYSAESEKNIDHENIINEFPSQNSTQNMTLSGTNSLDMVNREDINTETENNTMQIDILTDSDKTATDKINDFSIHGISTFKSTTLKSDIDQNEVLPTDSLLAVQIGRQEDQTTNTIEYVPTAVTTSWSYVTSTGSATPKYLTQTKDIITIKNRNVTINNSVKTNINESDIKPNKVQVESENISHIENKNNTKANVTTSNNSQYYVTFSDTLEQHVISTNYTITSDIQSNLNESVKRSNETSNELKIRGTENIKLNASSKGKITIDVTASLFDCSNYTRGKYADKKDCRKFYTCLGKLQPLAGICPNNTVFSEINKQCTRNLSHCVRNNQFRCLFEGRFNDFFKDNIYYICVKNSMNAFVRYKLQCLVDYHLNKEVVKCEKNNKIPSKSASSVSENSKINNDKSIQVVPEIKFDESKKTNSTVIELECESEGQFPHAKDCNKYYICTKIKNVYRRKIKKCASEEVYDKEKKKCVESDSSEC